jgi:GNAT superfamily N-acetyltransferase
MGPLDNFLRTLVSQYEKRRLGRTHVVVRPGEKRVLGYYTLASGAVSFANLPEQATKKLPRHPVPVILLARLALDQSVQGQGLGGFLLADALRRCLSLAGQLGVHAVEVDAIDDQAKAFYERYGFVALQDNPLHLYLPMATIEDAFGDEGGS